MLKLRQRWVHVGRAWRTLVDRRRAPLQMATGLAASTGLVALALSAGHSSTGAPEKAPSSPGPAAATTAPVSRAGPHWPDASNTGWRHTGVNLRLVRVGDSGPGWVAERVGGSPVLYVRKSGAVLDALDIPMCVKVVANDVAIKRSRITCAGYYSINASDPPRYSSGLSLTDVEVDGLGSRSAQGIAVMATSGAKFLRVDFHGFASSGPRLASNNELRDSWIHDFACQPPDHSAGATANDGGSRIRVIHNNVDINTTDAGCASTAFGLDQDFGAYDDVLVRDNLFNGGAYCMYASQKVPNNPHGQSVNIRVENNTFGRKYKPQCGLYGPAAQVDAGKHGNTFVGNVWGGGAAATAEHRIGDPVRP